MTARLVSNAWDQAASNTDSHFQVDPGKYKLMLGDPEEVVVCLGPPQFKEENFSLDVDAGEVVTVCWNTPVSGWSPMLTYTSFEMSFNGNPAADCVHTGAPTGSIQPDQVAGKAIKCVGPGKCVIQMAYTVRNRIVKSAMSVSGEDIMPVQPFVDHPQSVNTECINGQRWSEASTHAKLNHPAFVGWLKAGDIDQMQPSEGRISFARRVQKHMGETITYSFSPQAQRARGSPAEIVTLGQTDCGGSTYIFCASLARQKIPVRTTLAVQHIFPECYVEGVGWVPCEGEGLADSTGQSGHTACMGAPAVLDLSPVGGGSSEQVINQMPINYSGYTRNSWEDGRNTAEMRAFVESFK